MAYRTYAARPSDYAASPDGAPVPGATYEVYLGNLATRVTDLLTPDGSATDVAVAGDTGHVRFQAQDTNPTTLWLKAGTVFFEVNAADLGDRFDSVEDSITGLTETTNNALADMAAVSASVILQISYDAVGARWPTRSEALAPGLVDRRVWWDGPAAPPISADFMHEGDKYWARELLS